MARRSVQLQPDPAPRATFFGDFLFCQKRKLPLAGQALTPQSTEEPNQSPRTENRKQKTENAAIKSQALVADQK
jgi:hypothetical protein